VEHDQRNRVQIEIPARTVVKVVFPMLLAALIFITFGPRTFTP